MPLKRVIGYTDSDSEPSLVQFQYKSFRKIVMIMAFLGVPFILFYAIFYTHLYDAKLMESKWRLLGAFFALCAALMFLQKEYKSYLPWLVIALCFCCYFCLCIHNLRIADIKEALVHMTTIGTVWIVGIMAVAPFFTRLQILLSALLLASTPFIVITIIKGSDAVNTALMARQITSALFVLILGLKIRQNSEENYCMHCQLHRASQLDSMTQLLNRAGMAAKLKQEVAKVSAPDNQFGFVMVDIDNFKAINDKYGHNVGDEVIIAVAECLQKHVRAEDKIARMGGEEYLIMLPSTDKWSLEHFSERIRSQVAQLEIKDQEKVVNFTVSIGAYLYQTQSADDDCEEAIKRADFALYRAKEQGRNTVVYWSEKLL